MLKGMLETIKQTARKNFETHKAVAPVLFLNIDDNIEILPVNGGPFTAEIEKFLKILISENKLKEYAIIMEAWVADGTEETIKHKQEGKSLETLPGRLEVVLLAYSSPNCEEFTTAEITWNNDVATLQKWEKMAGVDTQLATALKSRFNQIWNRTKANNN